MSTAVRPDQATNASVDKDSVFTPRSDIDLSKPISELLRTETKPLHDEVHNMPAAQILSTGKLAKSEYIRFLFMLWHIYDELEKGLFEHRENDVIFQIYHPRVFSRASVLSYDICHLLDTVTWQTDPFYVKFFNNMPTAVSTYVDRLRFLGRPDATPEEARLLASHAYVRYLGDLSGGQMMRRKIVKAYELFDDGDGIAFYDFRTLDPRTGDRPANTDELKKIKQWWRDGVDEGAKKDEEKIALLTEANRAFRYNADLLACIDPEKTLDTEPVQKHSMMVEAGTSLGALVALLLAIGLTHGALVLGGFTGAPGGQKLSVVFDWIRQAAGVKSA